MISIPVIGVFIAGAGLVTLIGVLLNFGARFGAVERAVLDHSENDRQVLERLTHVERLLMEKK